MFSLFWFLLLRHSLETINAAPWYHVITMLRCDRLCWNKCVSCSLRVSVRISQRHRGDFGCFSRHLKNNSLLPLHSNAAVWFLPPLQAWESGAAQPRLPNSAATPTPALCWTATRSWSSGPAEEQRNLQQEAAGVQRSSGLWGNRSVGENRKRDKHVVLDINMTKSQQQEIDRWRVKLSTILVLCNFLIIKHF